MTLWVALFHHGSLALSLAEKEISFDRDIRPILSDNCFSCHGFDPETRKAGLRLDTFEGATGDLDGGHRAVVPGDPEASELLRRINAADPEDRMPPPDSHLRLSAADKELLRQWVASGAAYEEHWAFQPLRKPPLPAGAHPVDHWVKTKLLETGLQLNPPAAPETLARRLSLDLTGLPLSPEELDAFLEAYLSDKDAAVDSLLDQLLASVHFGERMAWDWLAASRYSDTNGYQGDNTRTMWPWRDWVVRAFNENLAWDRFTLWQIAGDLLPEPTRDQILATAFNRNHPINGEGGRIPEENRVDYVFDMTETMATNWLGLTMECSRCHDHKFDPISQRDYYALSAFFNQTPVDGSGGNPQTPPILEIPHPDETAVNQEKPTVLRVMVMEDREEPRPTYILERGIYTKRGAEVTAAVPVALGRLSRDVKPDRLTLARWLVSPDNPLTARVAVNRVWQMFFGSGLVKTSEDFGTQGARPSHPELLDALASDFMEHGWDVKRLVRQIAGSQVYRQSATISPEKLRADPDNRLLSRSPRYRLPSWMLRDQALAVSGLLVPKIGGPPTRPYQPDGIWKEASFGKKVYRRGKGDDLYRRSLYTFWRRTSAPAMFFDEAKRLTCEVRPSQTSSPLHALILMNDIGYVEAARALASKPGSLATAFRKITLRPARTPELELLQRRLTALEDHYQRHPKEAEALASVGEAPIDSPFPVWRLAARTAVINMLFNLDETLCRP